MNLSLDALIKPGNGLRVIQRSIYDYDWWNGRLLVWEAPEHGAEYILGIDSAEGVQADRSVCQVIKRGTLTYPDQQVAEFACDFMDPVDFSGVVNTIGRFYRDPDGSEAFCTIEVNNPAGAAILNTLRTRWDYTNLFNRKDYEKRENLFTTKLGWHTTRHNRGIIIARSLHALQYGDLLINSSFLIEEMADFESNFDLAAAKAKGRDAHDDRVMALMIGYFGGHDDEWLSGEDIAEERRLRTQAGSIQNKMEEEHRHLPLNQRIDWQNTAISYSGMMQKAEEDLFYD